MNKGKELLIDIITSYQDKLSNQDDNKIIICGKDIVDILNNIKNDKYYFGNLTDELIDEIIRLNKYKSHFIFIKKLYQLRDLYLGKLDYNIEVIDKEDHTKTLNTFIELIYKIINKDEAFVEKDQTLTRLNNLLGAIKYNEIINDQELIEVMVKEYNVTTFDQNMYDIMEYVSKHNVNILNDKTLEDTINISNELKISDVDTDIKDILNKLEINYNELSIEYKLLIKNTNKDTIKNMYELIKHNKVEEYGILHLIDRKNDIGKLALLLFSTKDTVKTIVDLFRDNNNDIDVKSIKNILNNILPAFLYKDNDFYKPAYRDFIANYRLLEKLEVNIASLLVKCPLIFIMDNEKLTNVLDLFNKYNVDSKKVINKLYKTIYINPDLLFDNIEVLKNYIDIEDYLNNDNYTLLKINNLDKKINYVVNKYNVKSYDNITKCLIKEVYDNRDRNMWGDIDA